MWKQVTTYSLAWRSDRKRGRVAVVCEDGSRGAIEVETLTELEALGSMLRNEKPIYYSPDLSGVRTGEEPPGEEEAGWNG